MNIKQMRVEITELIDSLKAHSDDLTAKQHIPQLELELILAKIEKLYKQMVLFNHYYYVQDEEKKAAMKETPAVASDAIPGIKSVSASKEEKKRSWPDLINLIGINQKFQITNELFRGNAGEFNEAVSKINSLYNKEEALIYVTGLKEAFSWKDDSPVAEAFIKVVMNRYN